MKEYDFIIIGSGPSGSMVAKLLGEKHRILVLEKMLLPREKSCSGVLINKAVERVVEVFGSLPDHVTVEPKRTHGINVITTVSKNEFDDDGINVYRKLFDHWLIENRNRSNVELACGVKITKYNSADITVGYESKKKTNEFAKARAVIACDGINGISRSLVGLKQQQKVVTYQRIVEATIDADNSKFYAFTSPEFSRYDAWFNNKNGKVLYGVSGYTKNELDCHIEKFESFLQQVYCFRKTRTIGDEYWCLPLIKEDFKIELGKDKMLFCGESAGLLSPFGEGMYLAFESAYILSKIINRTSFISSESVAEEYNHEMKPAVGYMRRQWELIKRIAPEFNDQLKAASRI